MRYFLITFILFISNLALADFQKPYFMSIKSGEVNARKGPGVNYPILFVYEYKWLPVKIIGEYDNWRKIKDLVGDESWVHVSFLSKKRTLIIKSSEIVEMKKSNSDSSRMIAKLHPNVVMTMKNCDKKWCKVTASKITGYVKTEHIWGNESLNGK